MDIIFATKNKGKLIEIRKIMENTPFRIISMEDKGIRINIDECADTFSGNAMIKAKEIAKYTNMPTLSDDSGLEIDFLDKAPGVLSARFLGEDTPYDVKNNYILDKLKNVPYEKRTARFVCAIAFAVPYKDQENFVEIATIEGYIHDKIVGESGFGYDPIFYVPKYNMTTAEMSLELKNEISHRGLALEKAKATLLAKYGSTK